MVSPHALWILLVLAQLHCSDSASMSWYGTKASLADPGAHTSLDYTTDGRIGCAALCSASAGCSGYTYDPPTQGCMIFPSLCEIDLVDGVQISLDPSKVTQVRTFLRNCWPS